MINYKKYINELAEDNKETILKYASKIGLVKEATGNEYKELEQRCYELLAEYDSLTIYAIDGEGSYLKNLYDLFKDDVRVSFWIDEQSRNIIPIEGKNVWFSCSSENNPYARSMIDYGDYRLKDKMNGIEKAVLFDNENSLTNTAGFATGTKKERNLCKWVPEFLKSDKELVIFTNEEKTLVYLKGLLRGIGATNKSITFIFKDGQQNALLDEFRNDLFKVSPAVFVEKDKEWKEIKRKAAIVQKEIVKEISKLNSNK
ncbi:hypothetical protein [Bacillus toyonensis]|uniref:hypothetical protein n=1 Tax=Bacillus toyonensis TaxID=155322 RepID=UPI002E216C6C|nr:hypothetical protein [Bacillus toyonensis]